jgi:hypothetical protein
MKFRVPIYGLLKLDYREKNTSLLHYYYYNSERETILIIFFPLTNKIYFGHII